MRPDLKLFRIMKFKNFRTKCFLLVGTRKKMRENRKFYDVAVAPKWKQLYKCLRLTLILLVPASVGSLILLVPASVGSLILLIPASVGSCFCWFLLLLVLLFCWLLVFGWFLHQSLKCSFCIIFMTTVLLFDFMPIHDCLAYT